MRAWQRDGALVLSDHRSIDRAQATGQWLRVADGLVEVRA